MRLSLKIEKSFGWKEVLLFLFIAVKPLYLWTSGNVQISEIIMLLLFALLFMLSPELKIKDPSARSWILVFFVVVIYQVLINTIWTFILSFQDYSGNLFKASLYYIFNFMLVLMMFKIKDYISISKLIRIYTYGIIASCAVSLFGIVFEFSLNSSRQTGFFNNPNQLGYFALIALTSVLIFRKNFPSLGYRFVYFSSLFMIIVSLSKASIIAAVILLLLDTLITKDKNMIKKVVFKSVMILFIASLIYLLMFSDIPFIVQNRTISVLRYKIENVNNENDTDLG